MMMAATLKNQLPSVRFLLHKKADPLMADKDGYTPLDAAAFNGFDEIVHEILKHHPTLIKHAHGTDGLNPMHRAAWGSEDKHVETIGKFLLMGGNGNIRAAVPPQKTVLMEAAQRGNDKIVQLLIDAGADVALTDDDGRTALHHAAVNAHAEAAKQLIIGGASDRTKDGNGKTARDLAPQSGVRKLPLKLFDEFKRMKEEL